MQRAPIPILAASLALAACSAFAPAGLRIEPLPVEAATPCAPPAEALRARDWEIIAGRLGDALIICEGRRALAAEAYDGVRASVGAQ